MRDDRDFVAAPRGSSLALLVLAASAAQQQRPLLQRWTAAFTPSLWGHLNLHPALVSPSGGQPLQSMRRTYCLPLPWSGAVGHPSRLTTARFYHRQSSQSTSSTTPSSGGLEAAQERGGPGSSCHHDRSGESMSNQGSRDCKAEKSSGQRFTQRRRTAKRVVLQASPPSACNTASATPATRASTTCSSAPEAAVRRSFDADAPEPPRPSVVRPSHSGGASEAPPDYSFFKTSALPAPPTAETATPEAVMSYLLTIRRLRSHAKRSTRAGALRRAALHFFRTHLAGWLSVAPPSTAEVGSEGGRDASSFAGVSGAVVTQTGPPAQRLRVMEWTAPLAESVLLTAVQLDVDVHAHHVVVAAANFLHDAHHGCPASATSPAPAAPPGAAAAAPMLYHDVEDVIAKAKLAKVLVRRIEQMQRRRNFVQSVLRPFGERNGARVGAVPRSVAGLRRDGPAPPAASPSSPAAPSSRQEHGATPPESAAVQAPVFLEDKCTALLQTLSRYTYGTLLPLLFHDLRVFCDRCAAELSSASSKTTTRLLTHAEVEAVSTVFSVIYQVLGAHGVVRGSDGADAADLSMNSTHLKSAAARVFFCPRDQQSVIQVKSLKTQADGNGRATPVLYGGVEPIILDHWVAAVRLLATSIEQLGGVASGTLEAVVSRNATVGRLMEMENDKGQSVDGRHSTGILSRRFEGRRSPTPLHRGEAPAAAPTSNTSESASLGKSPLRDMKDKYGSAAPISHRFKASAVFPFLQLCLHGHCLQLLCSCPTPLPPPLSPVQTSSALAGASFPLKCDGAAPTLPDERAAAQQKMVTALGDALAQLFYICFHWILLLRSYEIAALVHIYARGLYGRSIATTTTTTTTAATAAPTEAVSACLSSGIDVAVRLAFAASAQRMPQLSPKCFMEGVVASAEGCYDLFTASDMTSFCSGIQRLLTALASAPTPPRVNSTSAPIRYPIIGQEPPTETVMRPKQEIDAALSLDASTACRLRCILQLQVLYLRVAIENFNTRCNTRLHLYSRDAKNYVSMLLYYSSEPVAASAVQEEGKMLLPAKKLTQTLTEKTQSPATCSYLISAPLSIVRHLYFSSVSLGFLWSSRELFSTMDDADNILDGLGGAAALDGETRLLLCQWMAMPLMVNALDGHDFCRAMQWLLKTGMSSQRLSSRAEHRGGGGGRQPHPLDYLLEPSRAGARDARTPFSALTANMSARLEPRELILRCIAPTSTTPSGAAEPPSRVWLEAAMPQILSAAAPTPTSSTALPNQCGLNGKASQTSAFSFVLHDAYLSASAALWKELGPVALSPLQAVSILLDIGLAIYAGSRASPVSLRVPRQSSGGAAAASLPFAQWWSDASLNDVLLRACYFILYKPAHLREEEEPPVPANGSASAPARAFDSSLRDPMAFATQTLLYIVLRTAVPSILCLDDDLPSLPTLLSRGSSRIKEQQGLLRQRCQIDAIQCSLRCTEENLRRMKDEMELSARKSENDSEEVSVASLLAVLSASQLVTAAALWKATGDSVLHSPVGCWIEQTLMAALRAKVRCLSTTALAAISARMSWYWLRLFEAEQWGGSALLLPRSLRDMSASTPQFCLSIGAIFGSAIVDRFNVDTAALGKDGGLEKSAAPHLGRFQFHEWSFLPLYAMVPHRRPDLMPNSAKVESVLPSESTDVSAPLLDDFTLLEEVYSDGFLHGVALSPTGMPQSVPAEAPFLLQRLEAALVALPEQCTTFFEFLSILRQLFVVHPALLYTAPVPISESEAAQDTSTGSPRREELWVATPPFLRLRFVESLYRLFTRLVHHVSCTATDLVEALHLLVLAELAPSSSVLPPSSQQHSSASLQRRQAVDASPTVALHRGATAWPSLLRSCTNYLLQLPDGVPPVLRPSPYTDDASEPSQHHWAPPNRNGAIPKTVVSPWVLIELLQTIETVVSCHSSPFALASSPSSSRQPDSAAKDSTTIELSMQRAAFDGHDGATIQTTPPPSVGQIGSSTTTPSSLGAGGSEDRRLCQKLIAGVVKPLLMASLPYAPYGFQLSPSQYIPALLEALSTVAPDLIPLVLKSAFTTSSGGGRMRQRSSDGAAGPAGHHRSSEGHGKRGVKSGKPQRRVPSTPPRQRRLVKEEIAAELTGLMQALILVSGTTQASATVWGSDGVTAPAAVAGGPTVAARKRSGRGNAVSSREDEAPAKIVCDDNQKESEVDDDLPAFSSTEISVPFNAGTYRRALTRLSKFLWMSLRFPPNLGVFGLVDPALVAQTLQLPCVAENHMLLHRFLRHCIISVYLDPSRPPLSPTPSSSSTEGTRGGAVAPVRPAPLHLSAVGEKLLSLLPYSSLLQMLRWRVRWHAYTSFSILAQYEKRANREAATQNFSFHSPVVNVMDLATVFGSYAPADVSRISKGAIGPITFLAVTSDLIDLHVSRSAAGTSVNLIAPPISQPTSPFFAAVNALLPSRSRLHDPPLVLWVEAACSIMDGLMASAESFAAVLQREAAYQDRVRRAGSGAALELAAESDPAACSTGHLVEIMGDGSSIQETMSLSESAAGATALREDASSLRTSSYSDHPSVPPTATPTTARAAGPHRSLFLDWAPVVDFLQHLSSVEPAVVERRLRLGFRCSSLEDGKAQSSGWMAAATAAASSVVAPATWADPIHAAVMTILDNMEAYSTTNSGAGHAPLHMGSLRQLCLLHKPLLRSGEVEPAAWLTPETVSRTVDEGSGALTTRRLVDRHPRPAPHHSVQKNAVENARRAAAAKWVFADEELLALTSTALPSPSSATRAQQYVAQLQQEIEDRVCRGLFASTTPESGIADGGAVTEEEAERRGRNVVSNYSANDVAHLLLICTRKLQPSKVSQTSPSSPGIDRTTQVAAIRLLMDALIEMLPGTSSADMVEIVRTLLPLYCTVSSWISASTAQKTREEMEEEEGNAGPDDASLTTLRFFSHEVRRFLSNVPVIMATDSDRFTRRELVYLMSRLHMPFCTFAAKRPEASWQRPWGPAKDAVFFMHGDHSFVSAASARAVYAALNGGEEVSQPPRRTPFAGEMAGPHEGPVEKLTEDLWVAAVCEAERYPSIKNVSGVLSLIAASAI